MRLFSVIFTTIFAISGIADVRSQTAAPSPERTASDAVKCWSYADADVYFRSLAAGTRAAYIATDKGSLIAIDALSGSRLWKAEFGGDAVSNVAAGTANAAIVTRPVGEAGDTGRATLRVLSKETGILLWKAEVEGSGPFYLIEAQNVIVAAATTGEVLAFDAGTGDLKWKLAFAGGLTTTPRSDESLIVVATGDKRVVGVTLMGGESRMSFELNRVAKSLLFENDSVFVGDARGEILRFEAGDGGDAKWRYRAGAQIGSIADIDDTLLAASFDNFLYSVDRSSGHVNWSFGCLRECSQLRP